MATSLAFNNTSWSSAPSTVKPSSHTSQATGAKLSSMLSVVLSYGRMMVLLRQSKVSCGAISSHALLIGQTTGILTRILKLLTSTSSLWMMSRRTKMVIMERMPVLHQVH